MGGKKTVEDSRRFEKDRRDKLNAAFDVLCKLLPDHDPSVILSKIEILRRAAQYIRDLQSQNDEIVKLGSESALKAESEKLKKRIAQLLLKTKELVDALRSAGVPIPNNKKKSKKKQPTQNASSNQNIIAEKPLNGEAGKGDTGMRVVKCGCMKGEKKPLKEINPIATTGSSSVVSLPTVSVAVTSDQPVINGPNIIALAPSPIINSPIVATRIQSMPIARPSNPDLSNIPNTIIRPPNPSVIGGGNITSNMIALRNNPRPLTARFSAPVTISSDVVKELPQNKPTVDVVTTPSSSVSTTQPMANTTQLINLHQNNIISNPIVTPRIQNVPVIEKNILSNLGPGTLILADGRIVSVPPIVPQIVVKPQPAVILMPSTKKKEKFIIPKRREITKTTFANKAPIPAIQTFRLESCPRVRPKKKPKAIKRLDKPKCGEDEEEGTSSKKIKLTEEKACDSSKLPEKVISTNNSDGVSSVHLNRTSHDHNNIQHNLDRSSSVHTCEKDAFSNENTVTVQGDEDRNRILTNPIENSFNETNNFKSHTSVSSSVVNRTIQTSVRKPEGSDVDLCDSENSTAHVTNEDNYKKCDMVEDQSYVTNNNSGISSNQETASHTTSNSPPTPVLDCSPVNDSPPHSPDGKSLPSSEQRFIESLDDAEGMIKVSDPVATESFPVLPIAESIDSNVAQQNGVEKLCSSSPCAPIISNEVISNIPPCISSCSEQESIFLPGSDKGFSHLGVTQTECSETSTDKSHCNDTSISKSLDDLNIRSNLEDCHTETAKASESIAELPVCQSNKILSPDEAMKEGLLKEDENAVPSLIPTTNPVSETNEIDNTTSKHASTNTKNGNISLSSKIQEALDHNLCKEETPDSLCSKETEKSCSMSDRSHNDSLNRISSFSSVTSLSKPSSFDLPSPQVSKNNLNSHHKDDCSIIVQSEVVNANENTSITSEIVPPSVNSSPNICNSNSHVPVSNSPPGLSSQSERDQSHFKSVSGVPVSKPSDKVTPCSTTTLNSVDNLLNNVFPIYSTAALYSKSADPKSINTFQLKPTDDSINIMANSMSRDVEIYNNNINQQTFSSDIGGKSLYPSNVSFPHNSLSRTQNWNNSQYNKSLYNPNFGSELTESLTPKANNSIERSKSDSFEKQNELSQVTYFGFQNDPVVTSHGNTFFPNLSSCPSMIPSSIGFNESSSVFSYHNSSSVAPSYSFMPHENINTFSGNPIGPTPNIYPERGVIPNMQNNYTSKTHFRSSERMNIGNESALYSSSSNNLGDNIYPTPSHASLPSSSLPQPNSQNIKETSSGLSSSSTYPASDQNIQSYSNATQRKTHVPGSSYSVTSGSYNSISHLTTSHTMTPSTYSLASLPNSSHNAPLSMYNVVSQPASSHEALPPTYTTTSRTILQQTVSSSTYNTSSQTSTTYSVASNIYDPATPANSLHKVTPGTYNNIPQFTVSQTLSPSSYNTTTLATTSTGYNSTTETGKVHTVLPTTYSASSSISSNATKSTQSTLSQTSSLNPVSSNSYSNTVQAASSHVMAPSGYTLPQNSSSHAVISSTCSSVSKPVISDKLVSSAHSNIALSNPSHPTSANIYSYIPQTCSANYGAHSQVNMSNIFPKSSQSSNSGSFPVSAQSNSNIQDSTGFALLNSSKNVPSIYSNSNQSTISQYGSSYQSCTSVPNSSHVGYTGPMHQAYANSVEANLSHVTNTGQAVGYPCSTQTSNLPGIFTVLPNSSRIHAGTTYPNTASTYANASLPSMSYAYTTSTLSYSSSMVSQYTVCNENVSESSFNTDITPKNKKSLENGGSNKNNFKGDSISKSNVEMNQPSQALNKIVGNVAPDKRAPPYIDRNKDRSHAVIPDSNVIDHQQNKANPGFYNLDKDSLSNYTRTSMDSGVKENRDNVYGVNILEKDVANPQNSSKSSRSVDSAEKNKEMDTNKSSNHDIVSNKGKESKETRTETNIPPVQNNIEKASQNKGKNLDGQSCPDPGSNSNNKSASKEKTRNDSNYSYNHQPSYSIEKHLQVQNVSCNPSSSMNNNQLKSYTHFNSSVHDSLSNQYNMESHQRSEGVLTSGNVPQFSRNMTASSSAVSYSASQLTKTTFVDASVRPPEKKDNSVQKSYGPVVEGSQINKAVNTSDFLKSKDIERNTFIPIMDDVRLPTDFSTDLFSSLQVPTGGAHSESISPTAAFLLAFPLVSSSRAAENLNENENHDNQTSTPTTILQIGNIDPPSSEFFHPIDFQKGNPKPPDQFDMNSAYLNVNELPEKQSQSGYKRCDKRRDTFPDYNKDIGPTEEKQKSKPVIVTTNSYNQSYNPPLMSCNEYQYCEKDSNQWQQDYSSNSSKEPKKACSRKKEKVPQKGCYHQSYQEYYSYKDKKKKQQNRISVNWMSTPENREQPDYHNKESETINSLLCPPSQTLYGGISLDFPAEPFSDFPNTKKSNNYSWSPSKSLLPSLDNHLLIPSTLPTLVGDLALGTSTPSETYKSYEAPKTQIQVQPSKKTPEKLDVNKKPNEFSKTQANFFSVSQLVDPKSKKQKLDRNYKRSEKPQKSRNNFNCPKRKEDNCMYYEERASFPTNQNQYSEKRHPYKGGSYSAESLIGVQHNEMDIATNFNYQQNTNYFPSEFPPAVESTSQQYGYFQQTHFSGFSHEECQDFVFNGTQRALDNSRQKPIGRKDEHFPGAGLLPPQICSTNPKNINYNAPSSHLSTNTTSTLTNFNLSTIFPEMNDQRVGTSAQSSNAQQMQQQMNSPYSNTQNYRNHLS